jgi:RNA polymerase sigma-70 factor (ECF subfamily)
MTRSSHGDFERGEALSDAEIVEQVRAGRVDMFERLLRRYNQRVYRVARAVLRSDAEAEDVAQESWVRAWASLEQWEGRASFSTWLCRIALHEAWARSRRARRSEPLETERGGERAMNEQAAAVVDADGAVYGSEIRALLEDAVEALPENYRTVFVLRQMEELSTEETARCLDISEDAVKVRLHRARAALQRHLLERAGPGIRQAFPFLGARCDRMVATVMGRIADGGLASPPRS